MSDQQSNAATTQMPLTERARIENETLNMLRNLKIEEGSTKPAAKKEPGKAGTASLVDTNVFQIKTGDVVVYRYDVTMTGQTKHGKEVDLTKRQESSIVIADRVSTCRAAFRLMRERHPEVFGPEESNVFYDLQSVLYTLKPIDLQGDSLELTVRSDEQPLPANLDAIRILIRNVHNKARTIRLDDYSQLYNEEDGSKNRSVMNVIELAVNQYPMWNEQDFLTLRGSISYLMDGNKFRLPEKQLDRGGTKYLATGVQKSCAFIEGHGIGGASSRGQRNTGLLLETKHSPFHSTLPLLKCIQQNDATASHYNNFIHGRCQDKDLGMFERIFKKLSFAVQYPNGNKRRIELKTFHHQSARSLKIPDLNQSIEDYFYSAYNCELKFPEAHLIAVKSGKETIYFPPELLSLSDNQTVAVERMDAASKAAMIRECAVNPRDLKNENALGADAIHLRTSSFTQKAQIKFSKAPLAVPSRQLPAPQMRYAKGEIKTTSKEAAWRQALFLEPTRINSFAMYLIRSERASLAERELEQFMFSIQKTAKNFGMDLGKCVDFGVYGDHEVEECVRYNVEKNDTRYIIFISPENIKKAHAQMKTCEHIYNAVTQDIKVNTVKKTLQSGAATLENFIAKTNIKLGGLNYSVEVQNPSIQNELEKTLFIGVNTNQPGSKSMTDRVKSFTDEKPGVLGYCGNIAANRNSFVGDFVYIKAYRSELYSELTDIVEACVKGFLKNRNHLPEKVVFYHTGLAEGQYDNTLRWAVPLIRKGIELGAEREIPLTLLAVQKMNNVRLLPKEFNSRATRDHELNVPHGTVVDTVIVNPIYEEFYLMPHSALKGTGRSPRFTILFDENNYSADVCQGFTHALCYEHQIVSRTTSLPTPVYVAECYALRGRDVYNNSSNNPELAHDFPRNEDGQLDLKQLSRQLNYSNSVLCHQRVNA